MSQHFQDQNENGDNRRNSKDDPKGTVNWNVILNNGIPKRNLRNKRSGKLDLCLDMQLKAALFGVPQTRSMHEKMLASAKEKKKRQERDDFIANEAYK